MHPTLAQAITVEVITVVEALWGMSTDEIDVDAVAAEVIRPVPGGYAVTVTEQAFQEAVERHVR